MSKKKAPALHERRGREDISTRPPRLAGCPIKLAGDARLHRLSLAADSCMNRKYYGGDPGVGQRTRGFVHKPCIRSGPRGRVEIFARSSPGSLEEHIKCSSARAESTKTLRLAFGGACLRQLWDSPVFRWPAHATHNPYVGGLMCCVPLGYKVEMKVDRRFRPSSGSWSETQ